MTDCPSCGCSLDLDYAHEAADYDVACPECGEALTVHRHTEVTYYATRRQRTCATSSEDTTTGWP